jgi:hypothetical protein
MTQIGGERQRGGSEVEETQISTAEENGDEAGSNNGFRQGGDTHNSGIKRAAVSHQCSERATDRLFDSGTPRAQSQDPLARPGMAGGAPNLYL